MTRDRLITLVEAALTIALAATLHFVKVWQMPAGGSVSLDMLPILVLALRRGPVIGVAAGALFGVVDMLIEPYVVHWAQFVLDYPLAFGVVGLAGLFAAGWRRAVREGQVTRALVTVVLPAVILGTGLRYLAHFASGVVFFATTAMGGPLAEGQSAFADTAALTAASIYSAVYNLYVPVSAAGCFVALVAVLPVLERAVPSERA